MRRRDFMAAVATGPVALGCGRPAGDPSGKSRRGLKLSVTCDMFRGEDRGLPVDTRDGVDPRPDPSRKYTPDEAVALAAEHGYGGVGDV